MPIWRNATSSWRLETLSSQDSEQMPKEQLLIPTPLPVCYKSTWSRSVELITSEKSGLYWRGIEPEQAGRERFKEIWCRHSRSSGCMDSSTDGETPQLSWGTWAAKTASKALRSSWIALIKSCHSLTGPWRSCMKRRWTKQTTIVKRQILDTNQRGRSSTIWRVSSTKQH